MKIKIASPCTMRWEDMSGDERLRFCQHCQKHVYNFSAMTTAEVSALIREKEGKLCGRIFQRADGRVLTADCPVGAEQAYHRLKILITSAAATIVLSMTCLAATRTFDDTRRTQARTRISYLWDETIWKVKGWFGIKRPVPAMVGEICIVPPTPMTNAPITGRIAIHPE